MEGNSSDGCSSWDASWDYHQDPVSHDKKKNNNNNTSSTAKYKQKVGEGLGKTKQVASTGMKKVKEGTSVGFQWIKDQFKKTTQKH